MFTNTLATVCFALAILQTLLAPVLTKLKPWLGEVELIFTTWAGVLLLGMVGHDGAGAAVTYLGGLSFREPLFVFILMTASATQPVMRFAERVIEVVARALPLTPVVAFYAVTLTLGPLLGSLITEPAAMTVTALILRRRYYAQKLSPGLMYATIALLFVNVSIGGAMTTFAAPPVLMVAERWGWDATFMLKSFAWKVIVAGLVSTALVTFCFRRELGALKIQRDEHLPPLPFLVTALHLLALAVIVGSAHHLIALLASLGAGGVLFFSTRKHHQKLYVRAAAMVALFLTGLVILGPPQAWWLEPILRRLHGGTLFGGSALLTAILDNAALTYLGAQVPSLPAADRYLLVAGAVAGGGLSILANAPNPAGHGILNGAFRARFGETGLKPGPLFMYALPPTAVAAVCLYFF